MTTWIEALKEFFGSPDRPVTNPELVSLRKAGTEEFDALADAAVKAIGKTLSREGVA